MIKSPLYNTLLQRVPGTTLNNMKAFNVLFLLVGLAALIHFTPANAGLSGPPLRGNPVWYGGVNRIWNGVFFGLCSLRNKGVVRSWLGKIEVCNGYFFVDVAAHLGSRNNPALSCKHILDSNWNAPNGAYWLHLGHHRFRAYCQMTNLGPCGKGLTMIMKIDGNKQTFQYNSRLWTNKGGYYYNWGATGFDRHETKLPTYWSLRFHRLCLGMRTGRALRWINLRYYGSSLYSLIRDGRYRRTRLGRNTWKSLIPGSSLQPHCNKEGFNAYHKGQMARIGIIANQEKDCNTPDSRVAFGGGGSYCGTNNLNSCGNEAKCGGDNGNKHIKSFGYILAQ